jgi:hypothetical protein
VFPGVAVNAEEEWDGWVPRRGGEGWAYGGDGVDLAAAVMTSKRVAS